MESKVGCLFETAHDALIVFRKTVDQQGGGAQLVHECETCMIVFAIICIYIFCKHRHFQAFGDFGRIWLLSPSRTILSMCNAIHAKHQTEHRPAQTCLISTQQSGIWQRQPNDQQVQCDRINQKQQINTTNDRSTEIRELNDPEGKSNNSENSLSTPGYPP